MRDSFYPSFSLPDPFAFAMRAFSGARSYARRARADYFLMALTNYQSAAAVTKHVPTPGIAEILQRIPARSPKASSWEYRVALGTAVAWTDCFALEHETVAASPDGELAGRLRAQRVRYAQIASADEYAAYVKAAIDVDAVTKAETPPFDRLRTELAAVTERIVYLLTVSAPKENARGWLSIWTILLMLATIVVIFAVYVTTYGPHGLKPLALTSQPDFVPTESFFLTLFAGLVGGFVSVQQRLQQPSAVDPLYKRIELEASGFSIITSPVIGMIFACVLYVILVAGILQGGIFPKFGCFESLHCKDHNFAAFAANTTPVDSVAWALVALWAFAAGFLERLVPDILTRLGSVATDAKLPSA